MVTARFSSITPGTMVNGVWYKPVEQFILPKVSFFSFKVHVDVPNRASLTYLRVYFMYKMYTNLADFFIKAC